MHFADMAFRTKFNMATKFRTAALHELPRSLPLVFA